MNQITVSRENIALTEEQVTLPGHTVPTTVHRATLNGRISTGEWLTLTRTGASLQDALAAIETAVADLGWVIA